MTAFSARRRAEEFDSLVEGTSTGRAHDARYADFLDIVASLRDAPRRAAAAGVRRRPARAADGRGRHRAGARRRRAPALHACRGPPARPRPPDRRRPPARSPSSGPPPRWRWPPSPPCRARRSTRSSGAIENAETGFSSRRGRQGQPPAGQRVRPARRGHRAQPRQGDLEDSAAIADTLNTFTEQATAASDLLLADYAATGDESSIAELRDFTAESMQTAGRARGGRARARPATS